MKHIKVLHLVAGELYGGAAKGAYNLHLALQKEHIDSVILTNSTSTFDDPNIHNIYHNKLGKIVAKCKAKLDTVPIYIYPKRLKRIFSNNIFGFDFLHTKEYKQADIIHLHWINAGFISLKDLSKINKPIIWTLRDMWAFSGGCHYSIGNSNICNKYLNKCGNCETLRSKCKYDLSYLNLKRKQKYYPKHIHIVGISYWISQCARKSMIFKDFHISTIPNCIDVNEFSPIEKKIAKNILNIQTNKKILLCGANNLQDFYKGFGYFIDTLKILDKSRYFLLFFGKLDTNIIKQYGFEYKSFGYLDNQSWLKILYSAADIFIAPSILEAFGKTIIESLSCGTPVVAFDYSAPKDIIKHKQNGYLATPFKSCALKKGIDWIASLDSTSYSAISHTARKSVIDNFSFEVVAKQYINIYQSAMGRAIMS